MAFTSYWPFFITRFTWDGFCFAKFFFSLLWPYLGSFCGNYRFSNSCTFPLKLYGTPPWCVWVNDPEMLKGCRVEQIAKFLKLNKDISTLGVCVCVSVWVWVLVDLVTNVSANQGERKWCHANANGYVNVVIVIHG